MDNSLAHADIFFFVTTIAVVVVGLAFTIALVYLIAVLRRIRDISEHIREETVLFREDVQGLRTRMKRGFQAKKLFALLQHFVSQKKPKKSK